MAAAEEYRHIAEEFFSLSLGPIEDALCLWRYPTQSAQ
jgi:hypothetical protein